MSGLHHINNMDDEDGSSFLEDYELSDMYLQENPSKRDVPNQVGEAMRESRKRRPPSQIRNLAEKRRRERFRERILMLHQLMPNFNNIKTDTALVLDNAIEYIKTLNKTLNTLNSYVNGTSDHNYEGVIPDQAIPPNWPNIENYNGVILDESSHLIGANMENYNEGIILDHSSLRPNIEHDHNEEMILNQSFLPIGPHMDNLGPMDYYSPPHPNPMTTFSVIGYPEPTMIPPSNVQVSREMTNSMFFSSKQLFTPPSLSVQSSSLFLPPPPPSPI